MQEKRCDIKVKCKKCWAVYPIHIYSRNSQKWIYQSSEPLNLCHKRRPGTFEGMSSKDRTVKGWPYKKYKQKNILTIGMSEDMLSCYKSKLVGIIVKKTLDPPLHYSWVATSPKTFFFAFVSLWFCLWTCLWFCLQFCLWSR